MSSGYRNVLTGAGVIAVVFIFLSLWPGLPRITAPLKSLGRSLQQGQPAVVPSAPATGAPAMAPTSSNAPPGRMASSSAPGAPSPHPAPRGWGALGTVFGHPPASSELPVHFTWMHTVRNSTMHSRPGGQPIRAISLNHRPLVLLTGTYIRSLRSEGSWLLVLAPSETPGWVMDSDIEPASI